MPRGSRRRCQCMESSRRPTSSWRRLLTDRSPVCPPHTARAAGCGLRLRRLLFCGPGPRASQLTEGGSRYSRLYSRGCVRCVAAAPRRLVACRCAPHTARAPRGVAPAGERPDARDLGPRLHSHPNDPTLPSALFQALRARWGGRIPAAACVRRPRPHTACPPGGVAPVRAHPGACPVFAAPFLFKM